MQIIKLSCMFFFLKYPIHSNTRSCPYNRPCHFQFKICGSIKVEALWFKCFIVFLENLVLGTFICAYNESKI